VVESNGLENRRVARHPGFESLFLRQFCFFIKNIFYNFYIMSDKYYTLEEAEEMSTQRILKNAEIFAKKVVEQNKK
jgi:hypothetical protein